MMQEHQLGELRLSTPDNFILEESKWVLRVAKQEELLDPRLRMGMGRKPLTVRTNIIVHRQHMPGLVLEAYVSKATAELMQSVVGSEDIMRADLEFQDGVVGKATIMSFSPGRGIRLCQIHGYRLDGDYLTALTMTVDANQFDEKKQKEYLEYMSSVTFRPTV